MESSREISVSTWQDFLRAYQDVYAAIPRAHPGGIQPYPLFRGQPDANWALTTTLERYPKGPTTFRGYWKTIQHVAYPIGSYTDTEWTLSEAEYTGWLAAPLSDTHFLNVPGYELMVHLRHHGFPSPLLDWTRSPWIAAFFAFRDVQSSATHVAVFAYLESLSGGRSFTAGAPKIETMGPFVRTHRRHFLQQCEYTVCVRRVDPPDWKFERHDAVLTGSRVRQDLLWKFVIPATERENFLNYLEDYNIGAYSLFSTEETLMETLAARHVFLGRRI